MPVGTLAFRGLNDFRNTMPDRIHSKWFRLLEHPDPASMPVGTLAFRGLNDFRNMMPDRIHPKWFRLLEHPDPASMPVGALVFRGLNDVCSPSSLWFRLLEHPDPAFNASRGACLPRPERFQEHDAGSISS